MNAPMRFAEGVVLVLAAKRLTRLVTTDWIGEWAIVRPARKWAFDREGPVDVHMAQVMLEDGTLVDPTKGFWRTKTVSGLDCEWCVGVWAAALVVLPLPRAIDAWRKPLLNVLAVSQGVGMLAQAEAAVAESFNEVVYELEDEEQA